jgi:type VI secretion system protein VasD
MFQRIVSTLCVSLVSLALLALVACSSSKSRVGGALNLDTDLQINFIIDADINPDENKRPSPVFVRLYELKVPTLFEKADFIDIYEREKEALGDSMVAKQSLKPLKPNEKRTDGFVLQSGTRFIGLYAEFSNYSGSAFKVVFPITENNVLKNEATIKISGTSMTIVKK